MTFPWVLHLGTWVPDRGDPYLNAFILHWDFVQGLHDPLHLFDAPLFFPLAKSLAFSEHNFGLALPLFPLFAAGASPLLAHNVAVLLGIALSGYGTFRLARTLTGSEGAGLVAGVLFAFSPYRFSQLSHVNYLSAGWMALAAEAVVLFARKPSRRRAVWLGAALAMHGLSCTHWLILGALPMAATAVVVALRHGTLVDRRFWWRGLAASAFAAAVVIPFLLPYREAARLYGFTRTETEARHGSARPIHWLTADPANKLWKGLGDTGAWQELHLFPGLLALVLAGVRLAGARSSMRDSAAKEKPAGRSDAVLVGAIWAGLGFVGSLGMNTPFHAALFRTLEPFRSIRVPARWAMPGHLGLAVLAAVGVTLLGTRLEGRRGRAALVGALLILAFVDLRAAPLELVVGEPEPDELSRVLAVTPMRGGIVELPSGGALGNYLYVLRAADHGKPIVTAVSGFRPPLVARIEELEALRPVPSGLLDVLEGIPASYLVVHGSRLTPEERRAVDGFVARSVASGRLGFVGRFDGRRENDLYALTRVEPAAVTHSPPAFEDDAGEAAQPPAGKSDDRLTGSLDDPPEGTVVQGDLRIRGWARIPGEDLDVTVLLDGRSLRPDTLKRVPRPDVGAALPRLGSCLAAGYEAVLPSSECPDGLVEIRVLFRARDGRTRSYPVRTVTWRRGSTGSSAAGRAEGR